MDRRPIPDVIKKAMDEGTDMERMILDLLYTDHDFTFGYQGQQFGIELDCGTYNGIRCIVRGAVDEIGHQADNPPARPIDVKKFGKTLVQEYMTRGIMGVGEGRYAWQQSAYAHGYGSPDFIMPVYDKVTGKIIPKSLEPIMAPISFEQIRERVMTIEEYAADGKMPDDCSGDYACQYPYLHDQKAVDHLPDDAKALLIARINLDRKITVFTKAKDTLSEAIKGKLGPEVKFHLDLDDGTYTISVVPNSDRFNTDAAKALLTDAKVDWANDPDFKIPGEGYKLVVTKPKKGKKE